MNSLIELSEHRFDHGINKELENNFFAKNFWPLVYILNDNDSKIAYIGESTDVRSRFKSHLHNKSRKSLKFANIITSDKFNKSATLDIESNLIRYMSGDNEFKLLNGNLGIANHNYYQKQDIYWEIFKKLWNKLIAKGIAKHPIEYIENSDFFKYSPYKNLDQKQIDIIFQILNNIANNRFESIVIKGGAGTGKTIVAIFLFKILSSKEEDFNFKIFNQLETDCINLIKKIHKKFQNIKMGLVIPMSSFRKTIKKVFKGINGLNQNMVIGPSEVTKNHYDLLVVDESHRLRRRVNLTNYKSFDDTCKKLGFDKDRDSELDWVLKQSKFSILFYDHDQSIRPTDVPKNYFNDLMYKESSNVLELTSQFRVKGGDRYVKFIDSLLNNKIISTDKKFSDKNYKLFLFDNLQEMIDKIKHHDKDMGLSRVSAGFSWDWVSKNDKNLKDIKIDGCELMWNSTNNDWINSENSINEVGCIHTLQGYDLNYSGIIFGHEISYDPIKKKIIIYSENYKDKNGKNTIKNPDKLKSYIINIYKTLMLRAIKGTYIFVCDRNLKKYLESFINKYNSTKYEISQNINNIIFITKNIKPFKNAIPFYDLSISAGNFSDIQINRNIEWVKITENMNVGKDHFVCKVFGESMNQIIPNGSYCLFRKDLGGSRNGRIVLAERSNAKDIDFGSCYTIKEYHSNKYEDESGWYHKSIILKPKSLDSTYKDIELDDNELDSFKVIGLFEKILY